MNDYRSKILTGDWVSSAWAFSPEWTPYAQAIAERYPIQVPWFLTLRSDDLAVPLRFTQITRPHRYDVLIMGASSFVPGAGLTDFGNLIFLNITHDETGVPWGVPNKLATFPLPSIAGSSAEASGLTFMPIVKLPEAFFFPAHTRLKLDWLRLQAPSTATQAIITFVGVQLIGAQAPKEITMPDGQTIPVGSRLPWFATVPMGEYQSRAIQDFQLGAGAQVTQFLPPQDCAVEVHDAYSNSVNLGTTQSVLMDLVTVKLTDMGTQTHWTPDPAPIKAVFGGERQVSPDMPFTKPYSLRRGHRMQITMQNNNPVGSQNIIRASLTLRGVRRCEY